MIIKKQNEDRKTTDELFFVSDLFAGILCKPEHALGQKMASSRAISGTA